MPFFTPKSLVNVVHLMMITLDFVLVLISTNIYILSTCTSSSSSAPLTDFFLSSSSCDVLRVFDVLIYFPLAGGFES